MGMIAKVFSFLHLNNCSLFLKYVFEACIASKTVHLFNWNDFLLRSILFLFVTCESVEEIPSA